MSCARSVFHQPLRVPRYHRGITERVKVQASYVLIKRWKECVQSPTIVSHQFFCPLYPYTTHRKKDSLYIMSVLRFYSHNRSHHQVGAYIDAVILHLHWNQAFMMLKLTEGNILSERIKASKISQRLHIWICVHLSVLPACFSCQYLKITSHS